MDPATPAAVFLAPVANKHGSPVLPIQGTEFDIDPDFVAHIASAVQGDGRRWWLISDPMPTRKGGKAFEHPCAVYMVNGVPRAIVALINEALA